jgi:hypothetical protein
LALVDPTERRNHGVFVQGRVVRILRPSCVHSGGSRRGTLALHRWAW